MADKYEKKPRPKRSKKRRWLRRSLYVLGALVVLVWLSPYIISTGPGTSLAMSFVNSQIRGDASIEDLSLGWFGPTEIQGLKLLDKSGREVLNARKITYPGGMWRIATSAEDFGRLEIDSYRATIYIQPDGGVSFADAISSPRPAKPKPEGELLPKFTGEVVLKGGSVLVVSPEGRQYELPQINGTLAVNSLNDIRGELEMELAGGGRLVSNVKLFGMAADGRVKLKQANGSIVIRTEQPVAAGAVAQFFTGKSCLDGELTFSSETIFQSGKIVNSFTVTLADMQSARCHGDKLRPITLMCKGGVTSQDTTLTGNADLTGEPGELNVSFAYNWSDTPTVSVEQIIGAVLAGESISLPDFNLDVDGDIDVPRLAQAVPGLLKLRPGVDVVSGQFIINDVKLRGGDAPGLSGMIALVDLVANRDNQATAIGPVELSFDVISEQQGIQIRRVVFGSDFVSFNADGTPAAIHAAYQADLDVFYAQLGKLFDVGEFRLAGNIAGEIDTKRNDNGRVDVRANTELNSLVYKHADRELTLPEFSGNCQGSIAFDGNKPTKFNTSSFSISMADELNLTGSGEVDFQNNVFAFSSRIGKADLAALAKRAEAFGIDKLKGYSGAIDGRVEVARSDADGAIVSSGDLSAEGLHYDNRIIGDGEFDFFWQGVSIQTATKALKIKLLQLTSKIATVEVNELEVLSGEKMLADGRISVAADLQPCLDAIAPIAKWKNTPKLAGTLNWSGTAKTAGDLLTILGEGRIADLHIGTGSEAVTEDVMEFVHNIELNNAVNTIFLKKFDLSSELLTLDMTGGIEDYKVEKRLSLAGKYSGSWERLTALVHQLAPNTAENVSFSGPVASDFTITGTAYDPQLRPAYHDVTAKSNFGWGSGKLFGFDVGKASFSPSLSEGMLNIPVTEIDAAGGKMRLGGTVDLRPETPLLQMPGKLVLLEGMQINREVGKQLLSRFVPVFGKLHSLEGEITMTTTDLQFSLGEAFKQSGSGSGVIDLSKIKIQPEGVMKELLRLGGLGDTEQYNVKASDLKFTVKDGRIHYKDFSLNFADVYDMVFSGSVGFDDTVDAVISVPIKAALLEKLGIKGSALDFAKALEGARVDLHLVGTRDNLRLDYSKVNTSELIAKAMKALLSEKVQKDDNKEDEKKQPATGDEPEADDKPESDKKPADDKKSDKEKLIKDIFDILQDVLDKPDKSEKDDAETD